MSSMFSDTFALTLGRGGGVCIFSGVPLGTLFFAPEIGFSPAISPFAVSNHLFSVVVFLLW